MCSERLQPSVAGLRFALIGKCWPRVPGRRREKNSAQRADEDANADPLSRLDRFVAEFGEVQIQSGAEFHRRTHAVPRRRNPWIVCEATSECQETQRFVVAENLFHWQGKTNRSNRKHLSYRETGAVT